MQALNRILAHVGHPDAKPFTEKVIGKIHGYRGKYTGAALFSCFPRCSVIPSLQISEVTQLAMHQTFFKVRANMHKIVCNIMYTSTTSHTVYLFRPFCDFEE